jgi:hypothetical protein
MEQDFHTQYAKKYSKNVYKNLDTMKRNMDYTVWDQVTGRATAAANNGNVTERQLKLHGRWKTDITKDMYVHENVKNRLLVTENLGLQIQYT